jgi:hypothetical protein
MFSSISPNLITIISQRANAYKQTWQKNLQIGGGIS